jgi:hypothetical protein
VGHSLERYKITSSDIFSSAVTHLVTLQVAFLRQSTKTTLTVIVTEVPRGISF